MCEKRFEISVLQPNSGAQVFGAVDVRRLAICEDYRGVTLRCNDCAEFVHVAHGVNPNWRETGNAVLYFCPACGLRIAGERGVELYHFIDTIRHALEAWEAWRAELRMRQERRDKETRWIAAQLAQRFARPSETIREAPKPPNHKQRQAITNRQSGWNPKQYATA